MTTVELGNIGTEKQAKRIYEKLNGKTFFNFIVSYSSEAGNWPVSISTERSKTSKKELTNMILFVLASEI